MDAIPFLKSACLFIKKLQYTGYTGFCGTWQENKTLNTILVSFFLHLHYKHDNNKVYLNRTWGWNQTAY